jgi:membrane associated rhomboid family serine protease
MEHVPVDLPAGQVLLDVCPRCQFVWFDSGEYAQLPVDESKAAVNSQLPPEALQKLAILQVKDMEERRRQEERGEAPDDLWKYIPAFLGMPVEVEPDSGPIRAWLTWILSMAIAAVSGIAFASLQASADAYGLIPAQVWRMGGLTLITSFFLHAGAVHLACNIYYLMVFGDNVEAVLGRFKYLLLILFAAIAGGLAHTLGDPGSTLPCIGASGGISGVLAFYAIAFPRARLGIFMWFFLRAAWARVPAWAYFMVWIGLQVIGARHQVDGVGTVSYLAHLGGVAVGVVSGSLWRVLKSFSH